MTAASQFEQEHRLQLMLPEPTLRLEITTKSLLRRSPAILEVLPGQQDSQSELTLHDPVKENVE